MKVKHKNVYFLLLNLSPTIKCETLLLMLSTWSRCEIIQDFLTQCN